MKILFSVASRHRPDQFFGVIDNIRTLTANDNYQIVCALDTDDVKMTRSWVKQNLELLERNINIKIKWGLSKSKVHAINRAAEGETGWDILVNVSDDQLFKVPEFDNIIRGDMPEDLDSLLHYPDNYAKDRVPTMAILGRVYYERFGYTYNPSYYSLWCDNEAGAVAKILGKYKFIDKEIYDHYHYSQAQRYRVPKDTLYQRNDTYRSDEKIYREREQRNFDINKVA